MKVKRPSHRLRITELTQLGDKRFIGIVEFDRRRFLIGGSGANICMLADLGDGESFSEVLSGVSRLRELA